MRLVKAAKASPYAKFYTFRTGSTYKTYFAKLQTLQNKAMRIIEGLNSNARVEDVYNKYQILSVRKKYKYKVG